MLEERIEQWSRKLSQEERLEGEAATLEQLELWTDRILDAA
ncbi:MAG: hypothetical protein ACR2HF_04315 [Methylococcaceae bacterium]